MCIYITLLPSVDSPIMSVLNRDVCTLACLFLIIVILFDWHYTGEVLKISCKSVAHHYNRSVCRQPKEYPDCVIFKIDFEKCVHTYFDETIISKMDQSEYYFILIVKATHSCI